MRMTHTMCAFCLLAPSSALLQLYISLLRRIWIVPQPSGPLTCMQLQIEFEKFAWHIATGLWDSSYQDLLELVDLPTLECRMLETWLCLLYKIIYKLCYFNPETFTVSTSLSHHTPYNFFLLELTLIFTLLFLNPSSTRFIYIVCASSVNATVH